MKKIRFSDDKKNGFSINNVNDDIFISSSGYSHLFNYPIVLIKEVEKISKKINREAIDVYFDLSSVLGENASNKYFVITYSKKKKDFVYPSKKTLADLPLHDYNGENSGKNLEAPKSRYRKTIVKTKKKKVNTDDIAIYRKRTTSRNNKRALTRHSKNKKVA